MQQQTTNNKNNNNNNNNNMHIMNLTQSSGHAKRSYTQTTLQINMQAAVKLPELPCSAMQARRHPVQQHSKIGRIDSKVTSSKSQNQSASRLRCGVCAACEQPQAHPVPRTFEQRMGTPRCRAKPEGCHQAFHQHRSAAVPLCGFSGPAPTHQALVKVASKRRQPNPRMSARHTPQRPV
jgi:hypothetical protein